MTFEKLAPLAFALALLLAPGAAAPQDTPQAPASESGFRLSLGYDGGLLLKVLDIQIDERASAQGFTVDARLVSTGILAVIKHIDEIASSRGRIVAGDARPGVFEYQHLSGKSHRKARTTWGQNEVVTTSSPPFNGLGDPPASLAQKLQGSDPLTTLMRLSLEGARDSLCRKPYYFFDGKQFYALDFSEPRSSPPSSRETTLNLVNAFRCDVRYRALAGYAAKSPEKKDHSPPKPFQVDFAQVGVGGPWVISRLGAATPLGWATIELKRLTVQRGAARLNPLVADSLRPTRYGIEQSSN